MRYVNTNQQIAETMTEAALWGTLGSLRAAVANLQLGATGFQMEPCLWQKVAPICIISLYDD